ncbi:hypothetical protein [Acrocarpospora corrugata]|uniref:hypothetical protein n=1 Tax=Acrocarpospora corrugata TaxID=35763 RepID=UPI0014783BEE|nr:hypothetical protein [Acrocarpospora corrugata]
MEPQPHTEPSERSARAKWYLAATGGIRPWPFKVSPALAEIINKVLGEPVLKAGEPLFTLAPVLKFTPFRQG